MEDASQTLLSNAFYIISSGVLLGIFYKVTKTDKKVSETKKEVSQVNNAVNHVEVGKKPLTQRVDRIEETLHTIQYDMDVAKQTAMDVSEKTADNSENIDKTKVMVEELMKAHVANIEKLDKILKVMPKRKSDLPEV
jgi:septal ring factor EnvC (AmiA/AmiB activator)